MHLQGEVLRSPKHFSLTVQDYQLDHPRSATRGDRSTSETMRIVFFRYLSSTTSHRSLIARIVHWKAWSGLQGFAFAKLLELQCFDMGRMVIVQGTGWSSIRRF